MQDPSTKKILQADKIKLSDLAPVSVRQRDNSTIPETTALMNNYPNPFNANTTISYQLSEDSFVELAIYTILGQKIETLVSERQNAGIHNALKCRRRLRRRRRKKK
ncbi:T9SS type A sorting domain-containing protein, partial [candidate division KSB1 bacterium]|nr:T9SS type A sorting domain-containing protein [candidate division KSB1 bacterium]